MEKRTKKNLSRMTMIIAAFLLVTAIGVGVWAATLNFTKTGSHTITYTANVEASLTVNYGKNATSTHSKTFEVRTGTATETLNNIELEEETDVVLYEFVMGNTSRYETIYWQITISGATGLDVANSSNTEFGTATATAKGSITDAAVTYNFRLSIKAAVAEINDDISIEVEFATTAF